MGLGKEVDWLGLPGVEWGMTFNWDLLHMGLLGLHAAGFALLGTEVWLRVKRKRDKARKIAEFAKLYSSGAPRVGPMLLGEEQAPVAVGRPKEFIEVKFGEEDSPLCGFCDGPQVWISKYSVWSCPACGAPPKFCELCGESLKEGECVSGCAVCKPPIMTVEQACRSLNFQIQADTSRLVPTLAAAEALADKILLSGLGESADLRGVMEQCVYASTGKTRRVRDLLTLPGERSETIQFARDSSWRDAALRYHGLGEEPVS